MERENKIIVDRLRIAEKQERLMKEENEALSVKYAELEEQFNNKRVREYWHRYALGISQKSSIFCLLICL